MIKSMTGFSKKVGAVKCYGSLSLEIKSLNGKNLSINIRTPQELSFYEMEFRALASRVIKRGSVSIYVNVDYSSDFIREFVKTRINSLKEVSKIKEFSDFSQLLFSDLSSYIPLTRKVPAKSLKEIKVIAENAILELDRFRISEGKEIKKDLDKHLKTLKECMSFIEANLGYAVERKRNKLKSILDEKSEVYREEILSYAEKVDISEEVSRFNAHLKRFANESSGTSMGFLLQEMLREANTLSSKSEDINLISKVLIIKETIEKMKEQVLNVE